MSAKYGIGFWKPGSGIIHQVVLENYAFPGGMMIGTDSHTPNAGGLGMVAIGVGGADAVDVMTGFPFNVRWPKLIGVHLTGELSGWSSPEGRHPEGGRDPHRRRAAPAPSSSTSAPAPTPSPPPARRTICNMGAEIGATTLALRLRRQHGRLPQGHRSRGHRRRRRPGRRRPAARPRGRGRPGAYFDRVIEIDLVDARAAHQRPRHARPRPRRSAEVGALGRANGVPVEVSSALIGSCTNSSYEDITRAASIARQASAKGLRAKTQLLITPGSEQVRATIERDGLLADLEAIGGEVLANACGPCIGQWERTDLDPSKVNTIVNSYNRNFPKRNDGNANTKAFVTSPDMVIAYALAGTLEFNPLTDTLTNDAGEAVKLDPPVGEDLPGPGLRPRRVRLPRPAGRRRGDVEVVVDPGQRPAAAARAVPGRGTARTTSTCPVLMKAKGKCTTDHISAAGKWLKYRGHLENISGNLFLGVVNAFTGASRATARTRLDGETRSLPRHRQAATTRPASPGAPSATRTTARARPASTPPWSPGSATAR